MMPRACRACGHTHTMTDATPAGRFSPLGASGYHARSLPGGPLRRTRAEAIADECQHRRARRAGADR